MAKLNKREKKMDKRLLELELGIRAANPRKKRKNPFGDDNYYQIEKQMKKDFIERIVQSSTETNPNN